MFKFTTLFFSLTLLFVAVLTQAVANPDSGLPNALPATAGGSSTPAGEVKFVSPSASKGWTMGEPYLIEITYTNDLHKSLTDVTLQVMNDDEKIMKAAPRTAFKAPTAASASYEFKDRDSDFKAGTGYHVELQATVNGQFKRLGKSDTFEIKAAGSKSAACANSAPVFFGSIMAGAALLLAL